MKKLDHKNILQLIEVINDPVEDKLFMSITLFLLDILVIEYAEKG